MTPRTDGSPRPYLTVALTALLVLLAVIPRTISLHQRPVIHDESMFAYYAFVASERFADPSRDPSHARPYIHYPILHGPVLILAGAAAFLVAGDSIAVARALIAALSLVALATALALGPRRLRWWLAPLLFTSPILLFYSRFFRNDMLFCTCLMLGMLGLARGLSRRPGHQLWSVVGMAFMLALLTIKENALFIYAAGLTFATVYGLLRLLCSLKRDWYRKLFTLRPFPSAPILPPVETRPPTRPRRKPRKETYLKPTFEDLTDPRDASADVVQTLDDETHETRRSSPTNRRFVAWTSLLGWCAGVVLGLSAIAAVYGTTTEDGSFTPVANMMRSWRYWEGQHRMHRIEGPLHYHLPILLTYELPILLLLYGGLAWDAVLRRRRALVYLGAFVLWSLIWLVWRTIATPDPPVWLAPLTDFLHLQPNVSMLVLGLMIAPMLVWSLLMLIEHRTLAGWMGWWAACSLFQYSSAGEKVPWLTVHLTLPLYLMLAWVWAPRLRRAGRPLKTALAVCVLLATLIALRNDVYLIGARSADPRERIVYNHTSARFHALITNRLSTWEEYKDQLPLKQRRVMLVDDPNAGGPSWPGYWYFRHCEFRYHGGPLSRPTQPWDLIIATHDMARPLLKRVDWSDWIIEGGSLRDHWLAPWPEEYHWRNYLADAGETSRPKPSLAPLLETTLRQWWRYYWLRETWTPTGQFELIIIEPAQLRRESGG